MARTIDLGLVRGGAELGEIVNMVYPVGSIYMSVNDVSPQTLFGGEWEQLKDRFLLGAGDTYSNGATGGAATHVLTESELPNIAGKIDSWFSGATANIFRSAYGAFSLSDAKNSSVKQGDPSANNTTYNSINMSFGGGQAHNNMPPYLAVYMWKRTA